VVWPALRGREARPDFALRALARRVRLGVKPEGPKPAGACGGGLTRSRRRAHGTPPAGRATAPGTATRVRASTASTHHRGRDASRHRPNAWAGTDVRSGLVV